MILKESCAENVQGALYGNLKELIIVLNVNSVYSRWIIIAHG